MTRIWIGFLCCVPLLGQGNVLPILECVDTVTRAGTSRVAAPVLAGATVMSFTQPLPGGVSVVLNPGGANQETIQIGTWTTQSAPYVAPVTAGTLNTSGIPLAFAHAAGELAVVESRESTAYYGFFNLLSTSVTLPVGTADNFFLPGNPNVGQPSTFPPGAFRNQFAAPLHSFRDQIWVLDSMIQVARRTPELACGYSGPQVKAEPIAVPLGGTAAGLRLGTVTSGSSGPLTPNVSAMFRHSLSSNQTPTITSDVQFSNLRLQNGVIFGDVAAGASALFRHYFFILSVEDSAGRRGFSTGTADVVNVCPMTVTPPVLSNAYVNTPYSVNFSATGVTGAITFAMEGTLPAGLAMTAGGVLSGTPVQTGSFPVTLRSTGEDGCFHRTAMTLEVQGQLCAANVTPLVEITLGGFRQNLVTRRWQQTVTLRNGGQSSIFGPVALVADNLSANAALINSGGTTSCATPAGRPYVVAELGANSLLAPGATVAVALEFTNSSTAPITYTPRVIAGGAIR
jgi:hypothetical protein